MSAVISRVIKKREIPILSFSIFHASTLLRHEESKACTIILSIRLGQSDQE